VTKETFDEGDRPLLKPRNRYLKAGKDYSMPRFHVGTIAAGALAMTLAVGGCSMSNDGRSADEGPGATTGGVTSRGGIGGTGIDGSVTRGGTGDTTGDGIGGTSGPRSGL
jgi:hypothetical protein